jgi:two-component system NtrC family sensor kinase
MKGKLIIPLFWKFTIAILLIVAAFGTINLYLINYAVYDLFQAELTRHGKTSATSISSRSIDLIAYNDIAALNQYVTEQKQIDQNIAYIFIVNQNGKVLAHSFHRAVPPDLISINIPNEKEQLSIKKIKRKNDKESIIRDVAVPILEGSLGTVRLGLLEEGYYQSMIRTKNTFFIMIIAFSFVGIIGALIFSYIITKPIKDISEISKKIELGTLDIQVADYDSTINRPELVRWKNILNANDEIDYLITSFGEMVSRLRTTYRELQKTQLELFQSEKMSSLGTLSSGLAHEINNPLAGIQNCIRRLKESPDNLKQNISYLELMGEAVNKIEIVVGGLLDLSKKPEMQFNKVDLVELIENVLTLTAYQFEKSRISISKQYTHKARYIMASSNHIEQVILNLVLNGIEAIEEAILQNPEKKGEMVFTLRSSAQMYDFELSDNGIGIEKNKLGNVFDPFFSLKKIKQGIGLGLAVSYSIIEQHRGNFKARINNAGGLSFSISIPKFQNNV